MKIITEKWVDITGFDFNSPPHSKFGEYLKYLIVEMKRQGYKPADWLYCIDNGSIRQIDGILFEEAKFITLDEFEEDGDYGIVTCGKCGEMLPRCEVTLDEGHGYLCGECD